MSTYQPTVITYTSLREACANQTNLYYASNLFTFANFSSPSVSVSGSVSLGSRFQSSLPASDLSVSVPVPVLALST